MTGGRGGKRPGAGRPKGSRNGRPARAAKVASAMGDDVQEALKLLREFMRNKKLTPRLRKDCAIELLDRAIGRPTQHQVAETEILWHIVHDRGDNEQADAENHNASAAPVPETASDQG